MGTARIDGPGRWYALSRRYAGSDGAPPGTRVSWRCDGRTIEATNSRSNTRNGNASGDGASIRRLRRAVYGTTDGWPCRGATDPCPTRFTATCWGRPGRQPRTTTRSTRCTTSPSGYGPIRTSTSRLFGVAWRTGRQAWSKHHRGCQRSSRGRQLSDAHAMLSQGDGAVGELGGATCTAAETVRAMASIGCHVHLLTICALGCGEFPDFPRRGRALRNLVREELANGAVPPAATNAATTAEPGGFRGVPLPPNSSAGVRPSPFRARRTVEAVAAQWCLRLPCAVSRGNGRHRFRIPRGDGGVRCGPR